MVDVLHLIDTYRIGGPGKTIINAARYIDSGRYRVHVASFTSLDPHRNEFAAAVRAAGIPYLQLTETRRFNLSHLSQLREYIQQHNVRLLHTHGYRSDVFGYLAARRRPVALVTTHHGWIRNNSRQLMFAKLALNLCRRFHGVELVSERLRDELPASLRRSDRVAVVRNSIVLQDYAPRGCRDEIRNALDITGDQPLLGVIGRLSIEKGCLEMLEAFRLVAAERPQTRLLFLGEGPLHGQILARVAELGLQARVRLVPHQREIQPYYEALDVVVSPSRTEGLSNVILESLTVGKPVVATRVGGNAEIIADGVSGLLVNSMQPDQLAAAIIRVLDDTVLRETLIRGGTARVREEFAFQTRMRREELFYEDALARLAGRSVRSRTGGLG